MVVDEDTGGVVFVEVKCDDDPIRRSQGLMFEGIEEHLKMRVMIWDPTKPGVLTPWRSYAPDPRRRSRYERANKQDRHRSGPRPRNLT